MFGRYLSKVAYGAACSISVTSWALATVDQSDVVLFEALAKAARWQAQNYKSQELANTAWAFATVDQTDVVLFEALARAAERQVGNFKSQCVANTAWAFATTGQLDT